MKGMDLIVNNSKKILKGLIITVIGSVVATIIASIILRYIPLGLDSPDDATYSISSPQMDEKINDEIVLFSGTSANHNDSCYLWLVVSSTDSSGWWPQVSHIEPATDGYWESIVYFNPHNEGVRYRACLIATSKEGHNEILSYLEASSKKADYPAMDLPEKHEKLCEVYIYFR